MQSVSSHLNITYILILILPPVGSADLAFWTENISEFFVEIRLDEVMTHTTQMVKHGEAMTWNEEFSMYV
jgi:hypothetical protein